MTTPLTFAIPGVFPSLNVLLGWHWAKRGKHRKDIEKSIRHNLVQGMVGFPIIEVSEIRVNEGRNDPCKMAVDLTIYQPFRRLDQDNAEGSMKPVVDSLKSLGLIYRDSPKWLKKTITQNVDRKNPRVEISISQIGTEGK